MKKRDVLEWLEQVVATHKAYLAALEKRNSKIRFCTINGIHVYKGIEYLAAAAEKKLEVKERGCEQYPYEYWFEYKGMLIFQLNQEMGLEEVHFE